MRGKGTLRKSRLLFVSPWLLTAAIGVLSIIVVTFAVNNLRQEKRMMAENLLHKGRALVRFVGAGARASLLTGRLDGAQIQHLVEEAAVDSDIAYLAVVDSDGLVLAHSEAARVGQLLGRDMEALRRLAAHRESHLVEVVVAGKPARVFEVVSKFSPLRRGMGHLSRRGGGRRGDGGPDPCPGPGAEEGSGAGDWCRVLTSPGPARLLVLVGLDLTEQEALIRQGHLHLLAMSLVLLLVGVGGWLSLLVLQGYRVSQESLRQVQAFAQLLIGRLPVGIIATDGAGRIETCNPAAVAMLGMAEHGATGRTPAEALPAPLAEFFTGPSPDGEWLGRELTMAGVDDRPLLLQVSSVPMGEAGAPEVAGRVVLLHDVTALKTLEEKIRRHEQLVALGKMAAGVAHEVRNPLSSIKGFATLLGARFVAGSGEYESARLLVSEVERLDRTITELLNYARPLPLEPVALPVAGVVEDAVKLIRADADQLGVALALDLTPATPPVLADPDRLSQVLLNLLLNALQAMPDGGTLTVTVGHGRQAGMVDIAIADTGRGIPVADRERVCDPYFTTRPGGTGLGLAMVVKIVDQHHGALRIDSREGQGTTVIVSLPVAV